MNVIDGTKRKLSVKRKRWIKRKQTQFDLYVERCNLGGMYRDVSNIWFNMKGREKTSLLNSLSSYMLCYMLQLCLGKHYNNKSLNNLLFLLFYHEHVSLYFNLVMIRIDLSKAWSSQNGLCWLLLIISIFSLSTLCTLHELIK